MKNFNTYQGLESLENQYAWIILTMGNVLMPEDYSGSQRYILDTIRGQPKDKFNLSAAWLKEAIGKFPKCGILKKIIEISKIRRDLMLLLPRPSDEIVLGQLTRRRTLSVDIPDSRWDYVPSFNDDLYAIHVDWFKQLYGMFDWDELTGRIIDYLTEEGLVTGTLKLPLSVMPTRIMRDVKYVKENMNDFEHGYSLIGSKLVLIKKMLSTDYNRHNYSSFDVDMAIVTTPIKI